MKKLVCFFLLRFNSPLYIQSICLSLGHLDCVKTLQIYNNSLIIQRLFEIVDPNMSEFNDRVIQIASYYGVSKPADFAKKTGFSHQTASNYLKGSRVPNAEALFIIKQSFDISAEWLLSGEGEMIKGGNNNNDLQIIYKSDPKDAEIIAGKDALIETQKDLINSLKQQIKHPVSSETESMGVHSAQSVGIAHGTPTQKSTK